ncbi:hypothetical protein ACWGRL_04800 [[Kitasatospora] papulosa]
MSIDTSFTLQPTDPAPAPQTLDAPQSAEPVTPTPKPAPAVQHADGGLPAIPLLVITSNTAAAGLSAAAVVGGPLAAAGVAAAGIVTAAAAAASTRRKARKPARRAQVKPAPKTPPRQHTPIRTPAAGASRTSSSRSGGTGTSSGTRSLSGGRGNSRHPSGSLAAKTTAGKGTAAGKKATGLSLSKTAPAGSKPTSLRKPNHQKTPAKGTPGTGPAGKTATATGTPKNRLGQIKALRNAKKAEGKTRKEQREQNTANRRALKDGRRGEKKALKNLKKQNTATRKSAAAAAKHSKGGTHTALPKTTPTKTDTVRAKARDHQDQQTRTRAQRIRQGRRNAAARATLTRKVAASKARYATKAAGAALLSAPAALLGTVTTPLGRKLGWAWLMHPGRRMYRRLTANAKHNHLARVADAKNTHAHTTDPASLETDQTIADGVPRGPRQNTHTTPGEPFMTAELQFHFDESAADMEAAAAAYEPGGMIHVYQTIQGMPAGIQSWANTFKILAEKSDESFPLEAEVGEALTEVFDLLQKAAAAAEEVQKTFETKHEHDLERLRSPRKSLEAEKAWDIGSNEDLL